VRGCVGSGVMQKVDIEKLKKIGLEDYEDLCATSNVASDNWGHYHMDMTCLEKIDAQLSEYGFEVVTWENGEDREWIIVEKGTVKSAKRTRKKVVRKRRRS